MSNGSGFGGIVVGDRYGRLTALEFLSTDKWHQKKWKWKCDCGNETEAYASPVKSGHTSSCGCMYRESRGVATTTHGYSGVPEFSVYRAMLRRCYNEKAGNYHDYGGKGITVCQRWRESFENFLQDMGPRPSPNHSIDRENVYGNYEPGNCRWLDAKGQANNRGNNLRVDYHGESHTLAQISELLGMDERTVYRWLKLGLVPEEIEVVRDHTFRKGLRFCKVVDVVIVITTPDTIIDKMFENHFYIVVSNERLNEHNNAVKVVYGIVRRISIDS